MGYIIWIIRNLLRTTSSYGSSDTDLASLRRFPLAPLGRAQPPRGSQSAPLARRGWSFAPQECPSETRKHVKKTWKIFAPILHLVKNVNHQICFMMFLYSTIFEMMIQTDYYSFPPKPFNTPQNHGLVRDSHIFGTMESGGVKKNGRWDLWWHQKPSSNNWADIPSGI